MDAEREGEGRGVADERVGRRRRADWVEDDTVDDDAEEAAGEGMRVCTGGQA